MAFTSSGYHLQALAHKVYVEASYERDWLAIFIAWAVISYFDERK